MRQFPSARSFVRDATLSGPVTCLRPHAARAAAQYFANNFPGTVLYAVKTNPRREILSALWEAGIRSFDVASITEAAHIRALFDDAHIAFMHPIKPREAIARAYHEYGVRDFAFDSLAELEKIIDATGNADDLTLMLRLAVSNRHAEFDLSAKFGVSLDAAAPLLLQARQSAARLGATFHVGSQCMAPIAYSDAIRRLHDLIVATGILVDIVDIGGGFPALYSGNAPPHLDRYMAEIRTALEALPTISNVEIWAEPGRALVAEAASTLVQVDHRRDHQLYINDGTFGSLFDAGTPGTVFPVIALRPSGEHTGTNIAFEFYGPTCDGMDHMRGPFMLPADIAEGDYIEIGQTGAYGCTMRTHFNGFFSDATVILEDAPLLSQFGPSRLAQTNFSGNVTLDKILDHG